MRLYGVVRARGATTEELEQLYRTRFETFLRSPRRRSTGTVLDSGPSSNATREEVVMTETLKGACLCGRVEYEVQDPASLGYCHCSRCQRWTGSSLAGVVVARENLRFTNGEELVTRYESEFAPRHFCSNCGSSLYDDLGENYFVAAGLMRELELKPSFHLQVAYKAKWHEIGDDAPQYAENAPA